MSQQVINVPVSRLGLAQAIRKLDMALENTHVRILFNATSLLEGVIKVSIDEPQNVIKVERPSKIKQGTSRFYCVYQRGNKWTYKFVRKNVAYNGKLYDDEMDAVLAYDAHVYSVDGHTAKLNFPEHYTEVSKNG